MSASADKLRNTLMTMSEAFGAPLATEAADKLLTYMRLILEANKNINLTAIRDERAFLNLHILDSLSLLQAAGGISHIRSVIDIGSGAGFPGTVLAVCMPYAIITLLDATAKKMRVVEEICRKAGIGNVQTITGRAEDTGHSPDHRQQYDLAVCRALSALPASLEYCTPFVKTGGRFIAMKGPSAREEIDRAGSAHSLLSCSEPQISEITLPDGELRTLITYAKIADTAKKYPRKQQVISSDPLH